MQIFINWRGFLIQFLELSFFLPWLSHSLSHVHSFYIEFLLLFHKINRHKFRIELLFVHNDFLKILIFEFNMNRIFKIYFNLLRFIFEFFLKVKIKNTFLLFFSYCLGNIIKKLDCLIDNFKISFFVKFVHIPLNFEHEWHFKIKV